MTSRIENLVRRALSADDEAELSRSIAIGYEVTERLIGSIPELNWQVGREQRPYLRRACIDQQLFNAADRRDGWRASIEPNASGNCHHVTLDVRGMCITASHLADGETLPRSAQFREYLASANLDLFDAETYDEIPPSYAILAHSGIECPLEVTLLVPNGTLTRVLHSHRLQIVRPTSVEIETVADEMVLRLKKQTATQDGSQ